ncbi:uncharacterized protein HHUB_2452 [Halobacterium hubeiense]|uniref:DUF8119 domain-containing protein n=1 Tax=Halobacterium hubeiense TaxID=1407499 RepID=A0A0U5H1P7_9EURY|nr:hypothetical protein [Halobacterium hubeiense]CQH56911.1 uncharacterized protein HHUB_2452 [Halobacterium hubeiense]
MSLLDAVRDHVVEHHDGMLFDLAFAFAWVIVVTLLFEALGAPQLVYYGALASGVVAYYGFVFSLQHARESQ